MKKNILYIFHVSDFGGGSLCLLNIIKELNKDKFNPIVLLKYDGPICHELKKIGASVIIEPSINTVPYNTSLFNFNSIMQLVGMFFSLRKIKKWIRKTNAHIIHLNTMMMYPYAIPAKNLSRKVILHVRENWPQNENIFQLKVAKNIINKYVDSIIAINKSSSKIINLPSRTQIIYDWIDFRDRDSLIDFKILFGEKYKKLKVFLFLGGIQKIKGSLEVVKVFNENIKFKDARLLFVGCKSKKITYLGFKGLIKKILNFFNYLTYSDKIKKILQKDDRIICIPATNQVKSLINQSYCTISYPTFPHAIIPIAESICLGKPILSAKTSESLEYSNNGKGATLYEINNIKSFIYNFNYMYFNKDKIYKMSLKNKNYIRDLFSLNRNTKLLNKVYNNLI